MFAYKAEIVYGQQIIVAAAVATVQVLQRSHLKITLLVCPKNLH
jgi:hypothetical protein